MRRREWPVFPSSRMAGFTLVEVMVAMVISSLVLAGAIGSFEWAEKGMHQGMRTTRALAMVESRIAAKQTLAWSRLLQDDLDQDGVFEILMRDDGASPDLTANDGIYTASLEREGTQLTWTVEFDRRGPLASAAFAVVSAWGTYEGVSGQTKEVRLDTVRANPMFTGWR